MKSSFVTVIPAFDVAEFAQTGTSDCQLSRATIVPMFNVEQYARVLASSLPDSRDTPPPEAELCVHVAITTLDGEFGRRVAAQTVCPPSGAHLESVLDETAVRGSQDRISNALSHRAAFVLLHVDGVSTVREILGLCGIERAEALRALAELLDRGLLLLQDGRQDVRYDPRRETVAPPSGMRELAPSKSEAESTGREVDQLVSRMAYR